jgi:hypothetical protein
MEEEDSTHGALASFMGLLARSGSQLRLIGATPEEVAAGEALRVRAGAAQ